MKISLLLTPRLMAIISVCTASLVLLLLLLGYELGLRQAHEDYVAQARARGEMLYETKTATASKAGNNASTQAPASGRIAEPGSANQTKQEAP